MIRYPHQQSLWQPPAVNGRCNGDVAHRQSSSSTSSSRQSGRGAYLAGHQPQAYVMRPTHRHTSFTATSADLGAGAAMNKRLSSTTYTLVSDAQNSARQLRIRRRKYKTLLLTLALVLAYVLCWLPYNALMIWQIVHQTSYNHYENSLYFLYGLIVLNSVINPGTPSLLLLSLQHHKRAHLPLLYPVYIHIFSNLWPIDGGASKEVSEVSVLSSASISTAKLKNSDQLLAHVLCLCRGACT